MTEEKMISIIEGILFAWAEPVSSSEFSKVLKINEQQVRNLLNRIDENYKKESSGLRLIKLNNSYSISTKPENYDFISEFVSDKNKRSLSNASLETLSIIAYKQPVTKLEIEEIRGVKCDSTLKGLTELGLIEIRGQLDRIGKPNLYGTTEEFLKRFGISNLEELPKIKEDEEEINMSFL